MFEAPASPYLVPFDGSFKVADASTAPLTDGHMHKGKHRRGLTESLKQLQRVLAAGDRHAVLLVFQAMDAAGKDSTIRSVMQGVDPSGCQVFSFKKPSSLELDHDFLWRGLRSPELKQPVESECLFRFIPPWTKDYQCRRQSAANAEDQGSE